MYSLDDFMPEEGHFVAIWTYDGKAWSTTFSFFGGSWLKYVGEYSHNGEEWEEITHPRDHIPTINTRVTDVRFLRVDSDGIM